MTNEQALKVLRKFKPCEQGFCNGGIELLNNLGGFAMELAIKALEKQISKKPVWMPHDGENDWYDCPTCGRPLSNEKEHHCVCGQALIWE